MVAIRFEHVWKFFGSEDSSPAVADLDLEIADREFVVFVGPSGCGKTTCLRLLAGLERPSYGRVWIGGSDVTDLPPGRRDVGMVFQSYALYPHMTVYQNLAFGPEVRRESGRDIRQRVEAVAQVLEVGDLLHRRPGELSGGQRQRVALGRAMIRDPQLFLMDEPLSNLDAALRVQMRSELIRLHNRQEVTTVYVTHDQVEALTMGHRVAVMQHGRLHQIGTPTVLYDNPADLFVATFIGSPSMNIVPGTIVGSGDEMVVNCLGTTVEAVSSLGGGLRGREVLVGIRPHDMHPPGESHAQVQIRGVVDVCEHTGTEVFAWMRVEGERIAAKLPRSWIPLPGDSIDIAFSPTDLYLFDVETHASLLDRSRPLDANRAIPSVEDTCSNSEVA